MKLIYFSILLGLLAFSTPAQSASGPCATAEFRQLDFWVGDWDLSYDQGPGKPAGKAHNTVTKHDFGDCVITENFSMPGLNGTSLSTYHKPIGKWRQTWVDDQGGYYDLIGGPAPKGADYDFGLELVHPDGIKAPYLRMIWQIKDKDHLVWRWQSHGQEEQQWKDRWVLNYTRVNSNPKTGTQ